LSGLITGLFFPALLATFQLLLELVDLAVFPLLLALTTG
jgi:hypothetical protein